MNITEEVVAAFQGYKGSGEEEKIVRGDIVKGLGKELEMSESVRGVAVRQRVVTLWIVC